MDIERLIALMLLLSVSLFSTGCLLFSAAEPARQLQHGESEQAAFVDVVGVNAMLPRVQYYYARGIADKGDVSINFGSHLMMGPNIGLGGRVYLSEYLNFSLKVDGSLEIWFPDGVTLSATPRLTTSVDDGRPFYGGFQAHTVFYSPHQDTPVLLPGVIVGMEIPVGRNFSILRRTGVKALHVQIIAVPTVVTGTDFQIQDYFDHPDERGVSAWRYSQVSVGTSFGSPQQSEELKPTEQRSRERPAPDRNAQPESEPEPVPEPEIDDHGVPLY